MVYAGNCISLDLCRTMSLVSLRPNLDKFRIVDTKPENYSSSSKLFTINDTVNVIRYEKKKSMKQVSSSVCCLKMKSYEESVRLLNTELKGGGGGGGGGCFPLATESYRAQPQRAERFSGEVTINDHIHRSNKIYICGQCVHN